jgi:hypothetical protein
MPAHRPAEQSRSPHIAPWFGTGARNSNGAFKSNGVMRRGTRLRHLGDSREGSVAPQRPRCAPTGGTIVKFADVPLRRDGISVLERGRSKRAGFCGEGRACATWMISRGIGSAAASRCASTSGAIAKPAYFPLYRDRHSELERGIQTEPGPAARDAPAPPG